jgi:hypothetical protein
MEKEQSGCPRKEKTNRLPVTVRDLIILAHSVLPRRQNGMFLKSRAIIRCNS